MVDSEVDRHVLAALPALEEDVSGAARIGSRTLLAFVRHMGGGEDPAKKGLDAKVSTPQTVAIARHRMISKNVIRPLAAGAYGSVMAGGDNGESQMPAKEELELVGRNGEAFSLVRRR
jgi:hypothetical protein